MFTQQTELFKNPAFKAYFFSCMLAMFGNGLTYIIMIWVLMQFNGSVGSTAILMTCYWLPNVLLSPYFGVLADSISRKKLLLIANGARAACLFLFAWYSQYYLSVTSVYCIAVLVGCVLAAYMPASMTFIREIMPEEQMMYANAMIDIAYEMGGVMGMGGAGLILAFTSVPVCFAINGICYLLATWLISRIAYQSKSIKNENSEKFLSQLIQGWTYLRKRTALILLYLVQALFFVCYMTVPVLLAPFATSVLHADVVQFGVLEAMLSLGIILGGFSCPWFAKYYGMHRVILFLTGVGIMAFYLFSHTTNIYWAYAFHFLIGLSFSVWALLITLAQEMTDIQVQGRVQSLFNSFSGLLILGFYYMMAHWDQLPIVSLYRGELVLLTLSGIIMLFILLKAPDLKTTVAESG